MKATALIIALALASIPCASAIASPKSGGLSCTLGPATKTFGGNSWLVYGCNDGHSVVIVTAPGNPAAPFVFIFTSGSKGMELHGEGTGNKELTDAAFKQLKALSPADVATLFQQASAQLAEELLELGHGLEQHREQWFDASCEPDPHYYDDDRKPNYSF
jgi:hypothetical protein